MYVGGKHLRPKLKGRGMGSVLLNKGGAGGASSYDGVEDYMETTGRKIGSGLGLGVSGRLDSKAATRLDSLKISSQKKPKNIRFNI